LGWSIRHDALVEPDGIGPGHTDWLVAAYEHRLRSRGTDRLPSATSERTLVTIAVAHYNLGRYLSDALASLAAQTYRDLEVLVIDDGSTDPLSLSVLETMRERYPGFRFLRHANAGIGATRNRGLHEARGEYFIPMDADNIARADMVERFVAGMRRHPEVAALTCYFLAFEKPEQWRRGEFAYAYRPTGGPHVLASLRNVYGDANAIFRTATFRAVGGYETDRDTSWEDWEAFVKLVNAGQRVEVIPDHLFYYRHLPDGFSRQTKHHANQWRVLRQFIRLGPLPTMESVALWTALAGFQQQLERLAAERHCLRYRVADRLHAWCDGAPLIRRALKWLLLAGERVWRRVGR
jgi:glycosyltransferase involved in cell wall biosynthesis